MKRDTAPLAGKKRRIVMAEEQEKIEEVDEEAQLAQEALDATPEEEPAEEPEQKPEDLVPATVVATQRARARAAELEAARLRGENEALKKMSSAPSKSPLELAAEQQGVTVDEVDVNGRLYREQQAWEQNQAKTKSDAEIYVQQEREYNAGLSSFPVGEREELIAIGGHLLTEGDKRNIWDAGRNSGKELKRILTLRIEQAGLQPKEKPKKETDKPKKAEDKEKIPAQEEVLEDPQLDQEYKSLTFT